MATLQERNGSTGARPSEIIRVTTGHKSEGKRRISYNLVADAEFHRLLNAWFGNVTSPQSHVAGLPTMELNSIPAGGSKSSTTSTNVSTCSQVA